ncbi:thiol peroxidase [Raineyella sp.]|uniref:thiol peroxidase n=1 Tax=Raineyella sp. TaxID=1911550 RepID=UPI002B1FC3B0|nr:thiol peroxidase [Raineyella sp.]MEA5154292.1 thiol peroxidase [Raineyella sp.]
MATTAFKGTPVHTVGELPVVGSKAPAASLSGADLSELTAETFSGKRVILNIFPSIDTPVCATSVRRFNQLASGLEDTVVVCASADLPFAASRFCGAEGLDNVVTGSSFRSDFGTAFGVELADSGMKGLLARSVIVIDADGTVLHSQLVPEITTEPDYDAALAALA